jgi:hypothetical protein
MSFKDYDSKYYRILGIFIVALIILFMAVGLVGCSFMREMEKTQETSKAVAKADSSYLKKEDKNSLTVDEWTKLTERFGTQNPPVVKGGDTTINNVVYQPLIERIYERGSRQASTQESKSDSGTLNRIAAIEQLLTTKKTDTETKVLTVWHLLAAAAIALIIGIGFGKLKISLK